MAAIGTPVVQVKPVGQEEDGMVSEEAQFGWRFVYSITGGNDQQLFQVEPISGNFNPFKPIPENVCSINFDIDFIKFFLRIKSFILAAELTLFSSCFTT